jgi:hypothetical protein
VPDNDEVSNEVSDEDEVSEDDLFGLNERDLFEDDLYGLNEKDLFENWA